MEGAKRIMIVVWKWHDLTALSINNASDEWPPAGHQIRHDVFVAAEESAGAIIEDHRARVIRLKVNMGESNEAMPYIRNLANAYAKESDTTVFVFLHRRDGFTPEHVKAVLENSQASRCFLFGEGRDRLYYLNGTGLLGENGKFMYQPPEQGRPEVKVADYDQHCVFQPFFDKTWNYYAHEFGSKIFELKEDLLSHFCSIFPPEQHWSQAGYSDYLQQNRLLFLRLKSFISDDCLAKLSESEEKELGQWEAKTKKSYLFDDCKKNLEKVHRIGEDFDKLAQTLYLWLFDKNSRSFEDKQLSELLPVVQIQFQNLLDAIANDVEY